MPQAADPVFSETPPKLDWAAQWLAKPKRNFVGGTWTPIEGARTWNATDPANGKALADYSISGAEDVDRAVAAARKTHQEGTWSQMGRRERARLMRRLGERVREHQEELATLEALANGKLYREALLDDMPDSGDIFDYYAGWVDKLYGETCPVEDGFVNYTLKEPLGVCAAIVPWNFPLLMAMWKIAPALATGNCVVIKPSEYTPFSLIRFFELAEGVLPPGTLNLVLGDGETGALLSAHPDVDKIAFTGSTAVGREIVKGSAESNLKEIGLELGGKSPNIVFDDAPDLDFAIDRSYTLTFSQKGEKCSEPTRLLVQDAVYDQVVSRLAAIAEKVRCGLPFDPESEQGAQCNKPQFDKILRYIEIGKKDGAKVAAGGKADTRGENADGLFVRPTILADVDNSSKVAQDEIFGPVLVATRFKTEEEAIRLANDTPYGLAAGLWTGDVSRAHRVAAKLDAGSVFVNRYGCYDFSSPFGGFKQSGWGKEMGRHSLEAYVRTKSVWIKV